MWQIQRFHSFLWASGGCYSDFLIHNIDECCWMKDELARAGQASGGRLLPRELHRPELRQRTPSNTPSTTAPRCSSRAEHPGLQPGVRQLRPRQQGPRRSSRRCRPQPGQAARILQGAENRPRSRPGLDRAPPPSPNPYQLEWNHLIDAIRDRQALQRSQARSRSQPRSPPWAAWPPTPARLSPSTTC